MRRIWTFLMRRFWTFYFSSKSIQISQFFIETRKFSVCHQILSYVEHPQEVISSGGLASHQNWRLRNDFSASQTSEGVINLLSSWNNYWFDQIKKLRKTIHLYCDFMVLIEVMFVLRIYCELTLRMLINFKFPDSFC